MPGPHEHRSTATLVAAAVDLDLCDGYVVLVFDPLTGELDAHGPFDGIDASVHAERLRQEFDADELNDVVIRVSRLHQPRAAA